MKSVKTIKAYKYRFYPTADQRALFSKTFGCTRFVWNQVLSSVSKEYQDYVITKDTTLPSPKPNVSGYGLVNALTVLKSNPEYNWLYDISSVALQQKLLDLGYAFTRFFKTHKGYPKYKSKRTTQSFRLTDIGFRFKGSEVYLAKSTTPLKVKWSRDLPSIPSSCTITLTPSGHYYISFICEYISKKTSGIGNIGIDLGLKDFAILSDGTKVANPKYYHKSQKRLARLQKQHSRKKKGSANSTKSRVRVAKLHQHVSNQRNDFLHKLSTKLVNDNQVISTENLKVVNMVKNHKLAKSISDVAWSTFILQLQYKARDSQHCKIVLMDQWFPSSHLCSYCHTQLSHKLKLSDRTWTCPTCGTTHDRDHNAAQVIKMAGNDTALLCPPGKYLCLARPFKDLVQSGLFRLPTV